MGLRALIERHIPYDRLEDAEIPGVFPPVTIGRRELVDGGVADMTPIAAAIEQGATQIYVLPIGYPWLRQERASAIGMALQALARVVEQRLPIEVAAHRHSADIRLLPTIEGPAVSPADFSRTRS